MNILSKFIRLLTNGAVDSEIEAAQRAMERETIQEYLGCESHNPANPALVLRLRRAEMKPAKEVLHCFQGMEGCF